MVEPDRRRPRTGVIDPPDITPVTVARLADELTEQIHDFIISEDCRGRLSPSLGTRRGEPVRSESANDHSGAQNALPDGPGGDSPRFWVLTSAGARSRGGGCPDSVYPDVCP